MAQVGEDRRAAVGRQGLAVLPALGLDVAVQPLAVAVEEHEEKAELEQGGVVGGVSGKGGAAFAQGGAKAPVKLCEQLVELREVAGRTRHADGRGVG